jgi:hypothetical protein
VRLDHLRATLWLRWRILRNRIRRGGKVGNVLFGLLLGFGLLAAVGLFFGAFAVGIELSPEAEPMTVLLTWGGLSLAFLFFWTIGLVTDLQRSDAMSFKNLLHLPVSLGWVFLYNYLSSFVSLSVAVFLPAMTGLCLALVVTAGPRMLQGFPLLLGFLVMITALTYQLRAWLARLMENKRRGRNILALVTIVFVLLLQAPNLINLGTSRLGRAERREQRQELRELTRASQGTGPEADTAKAELEQREAAQKEEELVVQQRITLAAQIVPLGWLPYGMLASSQGNAVHALLCALGMLSIGALSLWRSFHTTVRALGRGGSAARASATASSTEPRSAPAPHERTRRVRKTPLVERSLPIVGDRASGVATATLRGLLRAPEVKLLLLSPVILLVVFGALFSDASMRTSLSAFAPSVSLGATMLGLLSILQLIQNQFGLDRAGFRAFVLSPVPRAELLLGKNLATAPLGLGIGLVALVASQFLFPADLAHFVGACLQLGSAYLLLCLVGNFVSILGPMRLREGSMKAMNASFATIAWQVFSMFAIPLVLSPLAIPAAIDFLLSGSWLGTPAWIRAFPLFPLLHALELVAVVLLYRWLLRRQGDLLQEREQHILDVLTRD